MHQAISTSDLLRLTLQQLEEGKVHDEDFNGLRLPKKVGQILDIGANRGQSIVSLKVIFPQARIHAFEANPIFFGVLGELGDRFADTVFLHRCGLGAMETTLPFFTPWVGETPYLEESSTRRDYYHPSTYDFCVHEARIVETVGE